MRTYLTFGLLVLVNCALSAQQTDTEPIMVDSEAFQPSEYFQEGSCDCSEPATCSCCTTGHDGKLLGFIAPTVLCHSDYISPMTNPVLFEDPRTLSEVRFIFIQHGVSDRPPLAGGNIQVLAAQIRVALTERLSIIANKDGYVWMSNDLPFGANDGWADIAAGLKYNLWIGENYDSIISAGATYDIPIGSRQALQGNGSGEFNIFAAAAARIGTASHIMSTAGIRLPSDSTAESQMFYWSAHLDRRVRQSNFYVFGEANLYHYMSSGAAIPGLPVGELDFFNFGAGDVAGNDIVTAALGVKYKPTALQEIGFAVEAPVTAREDVLDYRLAADWIIRY